MKNTGSATEKTEIFRDWQLAIDADMVLRGQGADPEKVRLRQPRLVALAEKAIEWGMNWIRPEVACRTLDIQGVKSGSVILENGAELKGYGISRRLTGLESVIIAIATLGLELERQFLSVTKEDMALGLALDGFGTAAIGALTSAAGRVLGQKFAAPQSMTTGPLYPGMRGWELAAAQTVLFSIVDATSIQVRLNSSFVMQPSKSISMVIGIGQKAQCTELPCVECESAASCRHKPSRS